MKSANLGDQAAPNKIGNAEVDPRPAAKRRSSRVVIDIPVTLFGQNPQHKMFEEQTKTLTVSAHGALIILQTEVDAQRPVIISNAMTGMEVQCRVAHRKDIRAGGVEIGIEFAEPLPKFWGIHFPPEDWNPAERKIPTFARTPDPNPTKGSRR